ncbi:unnamed protein product [Urochloa humidicola]
MDEDEKSKNQIVKALIALSRTLYQANAAARCTTSLPVHCSIDSDDDVARAGPLSHSLSLPLVSPFRRTSNHDKHISMQRVSCLFSFEVVAVQGLPLSTNGLVLAVTVRRKDTHGDAVQTMPVHVHEGATEFDEMFYHWCHLYCSGGSSTGKPLMFKTRPFLLSAVIVGALELDLGQSSVDLQHLREGVRGEVPAIRVPRSWDGTFSHDGKAKGGDIIVKLAFQIMKGLGLVVDGQPDVVEMKLTPLGRPHLHKSSASHR